MSAALTDRWQGLWTRLGQPAPAELLAALLAAHAQPQRHYHTLQHLEECLLHFDVVCMLAHEPAAVGLALWFHDAVYDVRARDNEARSAEWARRALGSAGLAPGFCDEVAALVMATCHDALPASQDARLLADIDLAILGAPSERFDEYERQIRAEYAHVPAARFASKRREILQGFLARPAIYLTAHFAATCEAPARGNLAAALACV